MAETAIEEICREAYRWWTDRRNREKIREYLDKTQSDRSLTAGWHEEQTAQHVLRHLAFNGPPGAPERLVYYLSAYADGVLTRSELVSWLAQLPPQTLKLVPPLSANPVTRPSIRNDAEELRQLMADESATVMSSSGVVLTKDDLQEDEPPSDCQQCARLRYLLKAAVHLVRTAQKVYAATHGNDEPDVSRRCAAEVALGWAFSSIDQRTYADMLEEGEKEP